MNWLIGAGIIIAVVIGGRLLYNAMTRNDELCPKCKLYLKVIDPDTGYMLARCRRCLESA